VMLRHETSSKAASQKKLKEGKSKFNEP
jgi:hypothetical protein